MTSQNTLLKPYRSLGLFIDSNRPFLYNAGKKTYLAVSTSHSFKVYTFPDLKIVLLGPSLPNKIKSIAAINELIYLATASTVYVFRFYHLVKQILVICILTNIRFKRYRLTKIQIPRLIQFLSLVTSCL